MEVAFPPPILAAQSHLLRKLAAQCAATPPSPPPAELEQADFLAIDDLLDFSNEDIGGPIEACPSTATSCELKAEACTPLAFDRKLSSEPGGFDSDSLCVPRDDLAELEWLSNFVEESFSSSDASAMAAYMSFGDGRPAQRRSSGCDEESLRTTSPVSVLESSAFSREKHCPPFSSDTSSVPARARSKRCRTAVCFWNTQILCAEASESLLRTPSQAVRAAASPEPNMCSPYYDDDDDDVEEQARDGANNDSPFLCFLPNNDRASNPAIKPRSPSDSKANGAIKKHLCAKPKKMKADDASPTRKCLHCATQKTPQWRAGPLGPKTLCNACGVRYKSGRLCDEYRPAASPTFMESLHSNSHRKVLEMRKQKRETGHGQESQKHSSNSEGHSLNSEGRVSVNTEE